MNFLLAFGTIMFAFSGASTFPTIQVIYTIVAEVPSVARVILFKSNFEK